MIRKILLGIDYSENSKTATQYALSLAKELEAELILFHSFYIQTTNAEMLEFLDINEFKSIQEEKLLAYKKEHEYIGVKLHTELAFGINTIDEINDAVSKHNVDLVILGLKGISHLESMLIGSTTLSMFTQSKAPLLAIPPDVKYAKIETIAFAYDGEDVETKTPFSNLANFAVANSSKIHAFTVVNEEDKESFNADVKTIILKNALSESMQFTYNTLISSEVQEGMNQFLFENKAEVLAIIPRKHSFFERLLKSSNSKNYALTSKIPLLILPE